MTEKHLKHLADWKLSQVAVKVTRENDPCAKAVFMTPHSPQNRKG